MLNDRSALARGKAVHIKDGWEFQFPEVYNIQDVNVYYNGDLVNITLYYKTDRGWEKAKVVSNDSSYPGLIELDMKTDAIRIFPRFSGKGNIASCKFDVAEKQKAFSIPLEKPPFVK
jgi:hypothetical protein